SMRVSVRVSFFFQAEDGIRDRNVTGVQTCALPISHVLADAVDQLTMSRFKAQDLQVSTKPDLTEVTDADQAAEQLVRSQLARSRSRDQVIGEEFGTTGSSARQWVIDPIDG